jgi:excinuclease UvrABC nuclease subunit
MAIRSPKWFLLATLVAMAPDTPGVFELWDDEELIYVGATRESLREELHRKLAAHDSEVTHFSWEISFDPQPRERELLLEYELEHHRAPRYNVDA